MFEIRFGQIEDSARLAEIAQQSYQQYVEAIGRKPAPMTADYVRHLKQDTVIEAIGENQEISGFAVVIKKADGIWLETIAVSPAVAGQGLGTDLIRAAEAWAGERADMVRVYTNAKMSRNLTWYPRLGYQEVNRRIDDGFERVFFQKAL